MEAKILRSTPLAAGIEFKGTDQTYHCWVWGNAVQLLDDEVGAWRATPARSERS